MIGLPSSIQSDIQLSVAQPVPHSASDDYEENVYLNDDENSNDNRNNNIRTSYNNNEDDEEEGLYLNESNAVTESFQKPEDDYEEEAGGNYMNVLGKGPFSHMRSDSHDTIPEEAPPSRPQFSSGLSGRGGGSSRGGRKSHLDQENVPEDGGQYGRTLPSNFMASPMKSDRQSKNHGNNHRKRSNMYAEDPTAHKEETGQKKQQPRTSNTGGITNAAYQPEDGLPEQVDKWKVSKNWKTSTSHYW